jgi:hypothetical protein
MNFSGHVRALYLRSSQLLHRCQLYNALWYKDTFLHENLGWLSKAVSWPITTTAGLGVIHKVRAMGPQI